MSQRSPQSSSYHSSTVDNIPHDNVPHHSPSRSVSPSQLCTNPAGGSPPHATAYLPPHRHHDQPQGDVSYNRPVVAEVANAQKNTTASDLSTATYPYTTYPYNTLYPTSTRSPAAPNISTTPTSPVQPLHTCRHTSSPYSHSNHLNPVTTQTSTKHPLPTTTPPHPLTSSSLSLFTSTTTPYNPFSHFLSTPPPNDPWNSVTYHARPPRD